MAEIKDLLAYLLQNYPYANHLSKTRTTKLIYLCDWRHCIVNEKQITNIVWVYDNFGPFVWDVIDVVNQNPSLFAKTETVTSAGNPKLLLSLAKTDYVPELDPTEKNSVDFVIRATKDLSMDAFIKLVYSTFPILNADKHSTLDLVRSAKLYRNTWVFKESNEPLAA